MAITKRFASEEYVDQKIANAGAVKTVNGNEPDEAGNVAVKVPLKLSDLENDLFYSKKEEFITLHRSDFTPKYHIDDEGNETDFIDYFYYKGNQELEWLTAKDKIGFVATSTDEEGNKICNTHNVRKFEVTDYLDMYEDDEYSYFEDIFCDDCEAEGKIYGCDECGVEILSRADIVNGEIGCGDTFLVTVSALDDEFGMYYDDIIIYKIDEKKIPIEYCDTSEIEEEIDALAEEVENL